MSPTWRKVLDITVASILTVLLLWLLFSLFEGRVLADLLINNPQGLHDYIVSLGVWARAAYVATIVLEVLIAFIPGWVVYPVGAAVFGFEETFWLVMLGNFLGASLSFWIGERW